MDEIEKFENWKEKMKAFAEWKIRRRNVQIVAEVQQQNLQQYDFFDNSSTMDSFGSPWRKIINQKGGKLLDIGGNDAYLKYYDNNIEYYAVNPMQSRGFEPLCMRGFGEYLPFDSNSFDVAVSLVSLEWCMDPYRQIKEVYRILKQNCDFFLTMCTKDAILANGEKPDYNSIHKWIDPYFACEIEFLDFRERYNAYLIKVDDRKIEQEPMPDYVKEYLNSLPDEIIWEELK